MSLRTIYTNLDIECLKREESVLCIFSICLNNPFLKIPTERYILLTTFQKLLWHNILHIKHVAQKKGKKKKKKSPLWGALTQLPYCHLIKQITVHWSKLQSLVYLISQFLGIILSHGLKLSLDHYSQQNHDRRTN